MDDLQVQQIRSATVPDQHIRECRECRTIDVYACKSKPCIIIHVHMYKVIMFSVVICMKQTKILCGQLNCSVKLAENLPTFRLDALVILRAKSEARYEKLVLLWAFYRTVKLSAKNLRLFHHTCIRAYSCKLRCSKLVYMQVITWIWVQFGK